MNIIWESRLDNKYDVMVDSDRPYHGFLIVKEGKKVLMKEEVSISFDAKFGPDVADVNEWCDKAAKFIDNRKI